MERVNARIEHNCGYVNTAGNTGSIEICTIPGYVFIW